MKLRVLAVAAVITAALSLAATTALAAAHGPRPANRPAAGPRHVRVLVLTMFSGETQPWLANLKLPVTVTVPGADSPLHCSAGGLCVTMIGEGKSNAGASVTAILADQRLSFQGAYFMTAGIAGTPPSMGTLGFAAWARYIADWDLGHHLIPRTAPNLPFGYEPLSPTNYAEVFDLNASLARTAYEVTRHVRLADSRQAERARARYPGQAGMKPFVALCDSIASDDYWAGATLSKEAHYIMALDTHGHGQYCTTEQEDSAVAEALSRFGYLDRYLDLRTASNFDQPSPGETVEQLLQTFPGYTISTENAYRVGVAMGRYLMTHHPHLAPDGTGQIPAVSPTRTRSATQPVTG
jgi:purine nucleoside permease